MNSYSDEKRIATLHNLLKWTYGTVAVIAGVDKFFNTITPWEKYVSPLIQHILPLSLAHFLYLVGIIEIIVGILILTKYTRLGAYLLVAWLGAIVINLVSMHAYYDICVRDLVMAVGAYVLAQLSE